MIDAKRYKQILFNLVGNALKFTFQGGIFLKIDYKDNLILTDCIDTGVGIK